MRGHLDDPGRPRFLARDDGTDRRAARPSQVVRDFREPIHRTKALQIDAELLRNHLRSPPEPRFLTISSADATQLDDRVC